MEITMEMVLENLKILVEIEFDADTIIYEFGDFEEFGENEVIVSESNNNGYDYSAYINHADSTKVCICLDGNVISEIYIA